MPSAGADPDEPAAMAPGTLDESPLVLVLRRTLHLFLGCVLALPQFDRVAVFPSFPPPTRNSWPRLFAGHATLAMMIEAAGRLRVTFAKMGTRR